VLAFRQHLKVPRAAAVIVGADDPPYVLELVEGSPFTVWVRSPAGEGELRRFVVEVSKFPDFDRI
jgi:hypothetical protein